jgi:flavodoxin
MKNRRFIKITGFILVVCLLAFGAFAVIRLNQTEMGNVDMKQVAQPASSENTLIVYLSRTGNTGAVAQMIQEEVGGMLIVIEPENPYPEDYQAIVSQVDRENETDYLPPLATTIDNIEQYDTVFIGAPTWDMQLPPPMKSFLNVYKLSGKTIVPFNTNGGFGVGSSFDDIKERCNDCKVLEGFSVEGGRERDGILFVMEGDNEVQVRNKIKEWLMRLSI